jgi:hypothetical protein
MTVRRGPITGTVQALEADPRDDVRLPTQTGIMLWWIPVGAGGHVVKHTSRWWELLDAHRTRTTPQPLFHAALEVFAGGQRYVIEMGPQWGAAKVADRGVVATGPVGLHVLGRSRLFRYEVRCWRNGDLPDRAWAVSGPVNLTQDEATAQSVLRHVPEVPVLTWGRQVPPTGDMWNSNSLVSWLLGCIGLPVATLSPPMGGRAPGWDAGVAMLPPAGPHPAR